MKMDFWGLNRDPSSTGQLMGQSTQEHGSEDACGKKDASIPHARRDGGGSLRRQARRRCASSRALPAGLNLSRHGVGTERNAGKGKERGRGGGGCVVFELTSALSLQRTVGITLLDMSSKMPRVVRKFIVNGENGLSSPMYLNHLQNEEEIREF